MNAADELEHRVVELLEEFTHDETPIAEIYSFGFSEDNKTCLVTVSMVDGSDTFITLTPGRPICVYRTKPQPTPVPKVRHLCSVRLDSLT